MIAVCPKCDTKNRMPESREPWTQMYRCGKCKFLLWVEPDWSDPEYASKYMRNGQIDWGQFQRDDMTNRRLRARAYEAELRKLSDDELMQFDIKVVQELLEHEKRNISSARRPDLALMIAICDEVNRRYIIANWLWRSWRKPEEYKKWVEHKKRTGQIAISIAIEMASRVEQYRREPLESEEYIDKTIEIDSES